MALGGNYLCAHLRRADFVHGREETTPTLRSAATQILHKLKALRLRTVFISSDCTGQEYQNFKSYLSRYHVKRFKPSSSVERDRLKPGGIAIVDQIICSHARYINDDDDGTSYSILLLFLFEFRRFYSNIIDTLLALSNQHLRTEFMRSEKFLAFPVTILSIRFAGHRTAWMNVQKILYGQSLFKKCFQSDKKCCSI